MNDDAAPGGDGSSWARAFDSLTDALAAATSGDEIWVAKGMYIPESPAGRDATFTIPDGVRVYGGFEGGESSLAQRGDPLDPPATLSGDLGAAGQSYHVVSMQSVGSGTVLDGFYIIRGLADLSGGFRNIGGGVYALDSAPTLANLVISQCHASSRGGGVALRGTASGTATLSNCSFDSNTGGNGSGVYVEVESFLSGCMLSNNSASTSGALHLGGDVIHTVSGCEFTSNTSSIGFGGAISVRTDPGSITIIEDCEFRANSGVAAGAISYPTTFAGNHTIRSSLFTQNFATAITASSNAVQFFHDAGSELTIENSLFYANDGIGNGTIVNASPNVMRVINCTIANNSSTGICGGVLGSDGDTRLESSIVWGNSSTSFGQEENLWFNSIGTLRTDRSVIGNYGVGQLPPPGTGSTGSNPLFVNPSNNFRLMPNSSAIDRGNNLMVSPFVSQDIYGDVRFADDPSTADMGVPDGVNPIIDAGAVEYQPQGGCNDADLAEPFGTLDFGDVLAFLTAFGSMSPAADLALPSGVFDFGDVLAFLSAFGAGCP